jgi:hypothetical protein
VHGVDGLPPCSIGALLLVTADGISVVHRHKTNATL